MQPSSRRRRKDSGLATGSMKTRGANDPPEVEDALANVHDVAAYILQKQGSMSTMKLQKLLYYAQAWNLAWEERPLFEVKIEAWANGPVVWEIFNEHRGEFEVGPPWTSGSASRLTSDDRTIVDAVLAGYGGLSGRQLSLLTHAEDPWREAREGLGPTDRSTAEITPESMQAFYAALDAAEDAEPVEDIDWGAS